MNDKAVLLQGDCLEMLKQLPDNSVDSLITDPPAGISFMGNSWDEDKGGRKQWVAWMAEVMTECLRVLKPGAHGLVWAIPRTSHWTASALEDAGFEIRDVVTHVFGSGFPKSMNIEKTLGDKAKGMGTALKPASEHWILVRKPISEKTVAANVLQHGTGGINIDASRIGYSANENVDFSRVQDGNIYGSGEVYGKATQKHTTPLFKASGRFPANFILSHNPDCVETGTKKFGSGELKKSGFRVGGASEHTVGLNGIKNAPDNYGTETVAAFECTPSCPVAELDRQSGNRKSSGQYTQGIIPEGAMFGNAKGSNNNMYSDSGGASRFFYVAKASKKDKGAENTHPTVKSSSLMTYLIKLITPPGGIVLDPFMGSGSTGVAATKAGFDFIGIEKEEEYFNISQKRVG